MIFVPDTDVERFMLEDIAFGDVTSRSLGLDEQSGRIKFVNRQATIASGVSVAKRILQKLGLGIIDSVKDGQILPAEQVLLLARGNASALHQGWKVAQNVLEWSCGVAQTTSAMVAEARKVNPQIQIACTRKSIPGTRLLATSAVLDGGGIIHRAGTAETVLLFANHRRFFPEPFDWRKYVELLRYKAPEKKIVVEADSCEEAFEAILVNPDIVQLDKFRVQDIEECLSFAVNNNYQGSLIAAGGIHLGNVKEYASTGVPVLVTSSPYYAKPADVRVTLSPLISGMTAHSQII